MNAFYGTIIYVDSTAFDEKIKMPYLYINRDAMYELTDNSANFIDFEKYDGVKVEIHGKIAGDILQVHEIEEMFKQMKMI